MLRRQKHARSQGTTPFACTLIGRSSESLAQPSFSPSPPRCCPEMQPSAAEAREVSKNYKASASLRNIWVSIKFGGSFIR